jgi:hypothetical protein
MCETSGYAENGELIKLLHANLKKQGRRKVLASAFVNRFPSFLSEADTFLK